MPPGNCTALCIGAISNSGEWTLTDIIGYRGPVLYSTATSRSSKSYGVFLIRALKLAATSSATSCHFQCPSFADNGWVQWPHQTPHTLALTTLAVASCTQCTVAWLCLRPPQCCVLWIAIIVQEFKQLPLLNAYIYHDGGSSDIDSGSSRGSVKTRPYAASLSERSGIRAFTPPQTFSPLWMLSRRTTSHGSQ
jgi:hypothetical protein